MGTIICHKPGTSEQKTLEVDGADDLQKHMEHGDSLGICTGIIIEDEDE